MKRIKWENVVFMLMVVLGVTSVIHHLELNGFYGNILIEIPMYLTFAFVFRYIVKDIRKNPTNWTL